MFAKLVVSGRLLARLIPVSRLAPVLILAVLGGAPASSSMALGW